MKNKIKILIMSLMILTGCSTNYFSPEHTTILVPATLLTPEEAPKLPKKYNEKEVSIYVLSLYQSFKINKENIYQIGDIIETYNESQKAKDKRDREDVMYKLFGRPVRMP